MNVGKILESKGNTRLFAIPSTAKLSDFVREACGRNVGALVVVDAGGLIAGILTERDVMLQCNRGVNFDSTTVSEIMTRNIVTVSPDDDIHEAMDLMIEKRIRHLPVVAGSKICGIITIRDLIYAMRKADKEDMNCFLEYLRNSSASSARNAAGSSP